MGRERRCVLRRRSRRPGRRGSGGSRRTSRLDSAIVSVLCRHSRAAAATGSASSPRTYEATTRSAAPRCVGDVACDPACSGRSSRPAASISGSTSTRVSSSGTARPRAPPRWQRPARRRRRAATRPPVGPLHDDLPEHGRRSGERGRGAVGEERAQPEPESVRPARGSTAIGRREPLDLLRDGTARAGDEPLDSLRQLRRQRAQDASAASTSSACVSGFTSPQHLGDVAVGVDHEGGALEPMYVLPESSSRPDAVVLGDVVVGVGEQRERQLVLLLELDVRALVVRADAEHDRAGALELAPRVADPAGLGCAAGRVVLGIEVEDDRLPAQLGQLDVSPESLVSSNSGAGLPSSTTVPPLARVPRCYPPTSSSPSS